jgi:transposase
MLSLSAGMKIYLCLAPTDMRRGFDGLARMTEEIIGADPLSGHLFVFRNRRRDRLKALYWDRDGLALWYKRLERGTFAFPAGEGGAAAVSRAELAMILEGIDAGRVRRRRRYEAAA